MGANYLVSMMMIASHTLSFPGDDDTLLLYTTDRPVGILYKKINPLTKMSYFGYAMDIVLNIKFVTGDKGTRTPFTTVWKCGNLKQLACYLY